MIRRDLILALLIAAAAFGLRVYSPWSAVFDGPRVNFLETDAWYHVRLIENQVRNWPWRVTLDPYAAPGGQFVPVAPLFDTLTSTVVLAIHGRDASSVEVERVAAFVPPILGALTVIVTWAVARLAFDRRAGLLAAALLAILPGHFLDRTLLGFVDHHALEALLAMLTLLALGCEMQPGRSFATRLHVPGLLSGLALGLYLLAWASGAFLLGVLGLWLLLHTVLSRSTPDLAHAARVVGTAALVAFILVVIFQDPRMHRYGSQIVGLVGLAAMSLGIVFVASHGVTLPRKRAMYAGITLVAALAAGIAWWFAPALFRQVVIDLSRLSPDPSRMSVLEARPLFLYPGNWAWRQPWEFFRSGFYVGMIALVVFTPRLWRERGAIDLLLWVFTLGMFIATIGQNRFGYYLGPACALMGGWLATRVLDWGGAPPAGSRPSGRRPRPLQREIAVVIVAGAFFAPNLVPSLLAATRTASMPAYWRDAMEFLRTATPLPFAASDPSDSHVVVEGLAGRDYYYARYPRASAPRPEYAVMNWWDHGYWVIQVAHRVPVSNPTQERAPNAARFYAATEEREALGVLASEHSRVVIADWELPFRRLADGTIMGRFQNIAGWANLPQSTFYEVYYRREHDEWKAVWAFHEPYYRSMAYRLMVLAGRAGVPSNQTTVLRLIDRVDAGGLKFREVLSQQTYATYDAARQVVDAGLRDAVIVGLDPWRSAFPVEALTSFREIHALRTPGQAAGESPWVRVFEVR